MIYYPGIDHPWNATPVRANNIMKRVLKTIGFVALALSVLWCVWIWKTFFRAPDVNLLHFPDSLIALDSIRGKELLTDKNFHADFEILIKHFEPQSRPAFCGVASSVIVLNSMHESTPINQINFFTDAANATALAQAVGVDPRLGDRVPSTKGSL